MVAFSLFCVVSLGFERSLPTPLASAALIKKSTAKFGERCPRNSPLVGALAPRLVFNGRLLVPALVKNGAGVLESALVPTVESPPTTEDTLPTRDLATISHCHPVSKAKNR